MNVKPIVSRRPNVIVVVPSKIAEGRVNCPVNVVLTPRVREHQNRGVGTQAGELFPEGLEVVLKEMAEEDSMGIWQIISPKIYTSYLQRRPL